MVQNCGKGGSSHKKMKKTSSSYPPELYFKEEGQDYALVVAMLGIIDVLANCFPRKQKL